jgi:hypothetical protein
LKWIRICPNGLSFGLIQTPNGFCANHYYEPTRHVPSSI